MPFTALCYHYVRPERANDPVPRLLGTREREFERQLDMLQAEFGFCALTDVLSDIVFDRPRVLITFDDGLADHFRAAQMLAERGISGTFFIPTCMFVDRLPPNPTIIHYGLALFGIEQFLIVYHEALDAKGFARSDLTISYEPGRDDPWQTIAEIKRIIKRKLASDAARDVLVFVYRELIERDVPDALAMMHLTEDQVVAMLKMGHSIGTHSHTHISLGDETLTSEQFDRELIAPRQYLEDMSGASVQALSYPFGMPENCLSAQQLLNITDAYRAAFTVNPILNTRDTEPLEYGRYMPTSLDTAESIRDILTRIHQRV